MSAIEPTIPTQEQPQFVHLQVHSEFSLVDGIVRIKPMVALAREHGMPAIAVTEQSNLFSLVRFYVAAQREGIKPIIGCDVWVGSPEPSSAHRMTLLCQSTEGYRRMSRIVSRSYIEGQRSGVPIIAPEWLEETDGLIALAGGATGPIGSAILNGKMDEAKTRLEYWQSCFPDRFYLDVQRVGRPREDEYIYQTVELAGQFDLPIVATNDVRFLSTQDFEAHEARVCIHDGRTLADPRRPRRYTDQQYLRSPQEMAELFSDLPEAVTNSVEIARRCTVELTLGKDVLPDFPVPDGRHVDEWFVEQSCEGLEVRLGKIFPGHDSFDDVRGPYDDRLKFELDVINKMGFAGYYLIVADFIEWARDNGVPVGPGRGSGAGSLVAYTLGITDLDPIGYDLLFERFLNPERVSMPDFDIDFCMDGRDKVIEYVSQRYGHDRVSQIITFGTMAAKAVVRDVGRVLGHPYGFVDQLAKLIPFELGVTLDKALADEEVLRTRYETEEEVRTLIDLARALEGVTRNAGKHAGGVVIAPSPLTDFTPLYAEQGGGGLVTQLDKDDVASVGLVKFDFLGLRTLTIIDWALRAINVERSAKAEPVLALNELTTDDSKTYALILRAETTAVFQLESRGMRDLIRRLQPDCFEDIIALVALFRPGPLQSGMVDDFIERKHGRAKVVYPHPDLEPILRPTYGVILYQEQVMQIAQVLAGYSLGGADILRKAMGKKQPEEMAKQRVVFLEGALNREVDEVVASNIFDLMEKFAGYGFNRSHSAAYALLSYHTAWLKAHYPSAFMAAVLSADMDDTDKVESLIYETRDEMGLVIEKPDINRCGFMFTAPAVNVIKYGLGALKGVGQAAIENVVNERVAGPFIDLYDFCRRIDTKRVNRRACEAMIRSGAMDGFGITRAGLMSELSPATQAAEQHARASLAGQDDMFGGMTSELPRPATVRASNAMPEWSEEVLLGFEKEALGLYLSGHPITRFLPELQKFVHGRLAQMRAAVGQTRVVAGFIVGMRVINSRKGRMAVLTLDDGSARMETVVYSDAYLAYRDLLIKDNLVVADGELSVDGMTSNAQMTAAKIYDFDGARAHFARRVSIQVEADVANSGFVDELARLLEPHRQGNTPVAIRYRGPDASAGISLGAQWAVRPSEELLVGLRALAGSEQVDLVY
jgi:DNA polymerase-3 subunit alpha